jgi:hypothetical protein
MSIDKHHRGRPAVSEGARRARERGCVAIIGDEVLSHHEQHRELRGVRVENFRIENKIAAVRHNWSDTY